MELTVSEVARLSGVTVRTLHHYDEIGLVRPDTRSAGGYRLYDDGDVERLQTVLFYRELGFPLGRIRELVMQPEFSRYDALVDQHALLQRKRDRLDRMIRAVERALAAATQDIEMTKEDLLKPFGDFDPEQYREEAEERWGHTDAYQESTRRAQGYSDADWQDIASEQEEIVEDFAKLLRAGDDPEGESAMDVAEEHRQFIDSRFYPCSAEMHMSLGEMYVADERFTAFWDKAEPGLAAFVAEAISANAVRQA